MNTVGDVLGVPLEERVDGLRRVMLSTRREDRTWSCPWSVEERWSLLYLAVFGDTDPSVILDAARRAIPRRHDSTRPSRP